MNSNFRDMRRNDRNLSQEEARKILESVSFGTLAVDSVEGYPYSVPLSFAYGDNKIYFHGSNKGLKYESVKERDKVSFSAVERDDVVPSDFTTKYRSVIAYGKCRVVEDDSEKSKALELLVKKYSPGFEVEGKEYARKAQDAFVVYAIDIEHMTAKSNI